MFLNERMRSYTKYPFEKQSTKYGNSQYDLIIFRANKGSQNPLFKQIYQKLN